MPNDDFNKQPPPYVPPPIEEIERQLRIQYAFEHGLPYPDDGPSAYFRAREGRDTRRIVHLADGMPRRKAA